MTAFVVCTATLFTIEYIFSRGHITITQASLLSIAIKTRAEQTRLFCRTVATKRNEVHLKEGLGGL